MTKKILWIEDEIWKIGELTYGLKQKGIEIKEVQEEKKWNIEILRKEGYYNIVVLDIILQKGRGYIDDIQEDMRNRGKKLLKEIRTKWPNTPIIVLTGLRTIEHKDEIMKLGASECIEKPITMREFEEVIYKYVQV